MTVTIAEELLLLAYNEQGRPLVNTTQLDPAPVGDAELDATLARIAAESKERKPTWWVQRLQSHNRTRARPS